MVLITPEWKADSIATSMSTHFQTSIGIVPTCRTKMQQTLRCAPVLDDRSAAKTCSTLFCCYTTQRWQLRTAACLFTAVW
jgi:hypothetical protein